ncbi:MAG: IS1 family transposase [Oligoflexales bacterium]|nr:IS1 family transposase [Oligoflexales bacterium]
MQCPKCQSTQFKKNGGFFRKNDEKKVQRFKCLDCFKNFSSQTFAFNRWEKKYHLNETIFILLAKGLSQRACAEVLKIRPTTVDRRVPKFGKLAKNLLNNYWKSRIPPKVVMFDEAESFIHSKCKPVTIPIAVESKTRRIIALDIGNIRGKGHLAKIAAERYPEHKSEKNLVLNNFFAQLKTRIQPEAALYSDKSHFYIKRVKQHFPYSNYKQYKGRRGCVVGQGELKSGGHDPLFSLNHSIAMIRDCIKRMARRTWCTSKLKKRLLNMLNIYAIYHNIKIDIKLQNKSKHPKSRPLKMLCQSSGIFLAPMLGGSF